MNTIDNNATPGHAKRAFYGVKPALVFLGLYSFAGAALAYGGTDTKVTSFLNNINGLLNLASIAVVTIAIIFAGYQIAFAHKRIADVAPILIGGLLIGAAAQLAKMLIGDPEAPTTGLLFQALPLIYA